MRNIVAIIGQPNTGKTTLAKKLKNILPESILIETDWIQIRAIKAGLLPKWKDYSKKLGQLLQSLNDEEKLNLKKLLQHEIDAAKSHNIIIEGYALTLPEYADIIPEDAIRINKESIHDFSEISLSALILEIQRRAREHINKNMPRFYQRFEFTGGASDSDSIAKWQALNLNNLIGKRVLDVGCNTGFFTFECEKIGAAEVIGIDSAELAIDIANTLKNSIYLSHNTKFQVLDVHNVSTLGKFDCIMALSMLHYIPDQDIVIKQLYDMLNPGGILKLEMGVHFKTDQINGKYYPSFGHLQRLFPGEIEISSSVNQAGDYIPRYVITVVK